MDNFLKAFLRSDHAGEVGAVYIYKGILKVAKDAELVSFSKRHLATEESHLQEIEAVLNFLNIQLRKIRRKHFQKYLEGYARALTSRDAEKYVDGEDEVIDFETIINEVALLRNRWLGIMKGLDTKQWQMGHVVRLRTAGMEDIRID